ncbi:unnamed protein product [Adineta steineri]|uniref:N-acetyltransferase domain-containing protein n=1 Tax=Adineta steineri TaxID=433720 RepID=A0A818FTV0_9BILA|nr:unnamed protein product [Adineta steineri]CAF0840595.1 unnamed protein product [Adineta steineri]CAF3479072.1 unnamed protein product [Adineta steineri]CAF3729681.1 unnamed protein product [Adineta steineri]
MFLLSNVLFFLSIFILSSKANFDIQCSNGRQALWSFDMFNFTFSVRCSTPGQSCRNKTGKCNKQFLCCPRTFKMSSKSRLYDRASDIKLIRIGNDYKNLYRLFEIHLLSNPQANYDFRTRWLFFDKTLRDLFEMPNAKFWFSIIDCMQNHGIAYAYVPLNATSITSNISAMTILTRQKNSTDSIYICYMATRKQHRRQGLGTRLLQQIVHRALHEQKHGIKYITMHVNTLNIIALELYERCGWRCYDYLPSYLDHDPHHITNHAYALRLYLENVKNVTSLCRDSKAIHMNPFDNELSIRNCNRAPVHL